MRPYTKTRAALNRAAAPIRAALRDEVGVCEWCRDCPFDTLAPHEIPRGGTRRQSLTERAVILILGNGPKGTAESCHSVVGRMPRAKQLAILYRSRPLDFNLETYNRIAGRRIEREDVMAYVRELDERILTQGS